jgi:hypothetical protein
LWATIAQIAGGGVFLPIYYGLFLLFTTPIAQQPAAQRKVNLTDAWIYLPLMFVFNYGPVVGMLYHPTLAGRHYWTWFWQLYSVRMTIAYYAISFLASILPLPRLALRGSYRTTVTVMLAPCIAISAALWIYTLFNCPYPFSHIFWPQAFAEDTWINRLRRILQLDYVFVSGTGLLWVFGVLRDAGLHGVAGTMKIALLGGIATVCVGPGATLGLLWLWREMMVTSGGKEQKDRRR